MTDAITVLAIGFVGGVVGCAAASLVDMVFFEWKPCLRKPKRRMPPRARDAVTGRFITRKDTPE